MADKLPTLDELNAGLKKPLPTLDELNGKSGGSVVGPVQQPPAPVVQKTPSDFLKDLPFNMGAQPTQQPVSGQVNSGPDVQGLGGVSTAGAPFDSAAQLEVQKSFNKPNSGYVQPQLQAAPVQQDVSPFKYSWSIDTPGGQSVAQKDPLVTEQEALDAGKQNKFVDYVVQKSDILNLDTNDPAKVKQSMFDNGIIGRQLIGDDIVQLSTDENKYTLTKEAMDINLGVLQGYIKQAQDPAQKQQLVDKYNKLLNISSSLIDDYPEVKKQMEKQGKIDDAYRSLPPVLKEVSQLGVGVRNGILEGLGNVIGFTSRVEGMPETADNIYELSQSMKGDVPSGKDEWGNTNYVESAFNAAGALVPFIAAYATGAGEISSVAQMAGVTAPVAETLGSVLVNIPLGYESAIKQGQDAGIKNESDLNFYALNSTMLTGMVFSALPALKTLQGTDVAIKDGALAFAKALTMGEGKDLALKNATDALLKSLGHVAENAGIATSNSVLQKVLQQSTDVLTGKSNFDPSLSPEEVMDELAINALAFTPLSAMHGVHVYDSNNALYNGALVRAARDPKKFQDILTNKYRRGDISLKEYTDANFVISDVAGLLNKMPRNYETNKIVKLLPLVKEKTDVEKQKEDLTVQKETMDSGFHDEVNNQIEGLQQQSDVLTEDIKNETTPNDTHHPVTDRLSAVDPGSLVVYNGEGGELVKNDNGYFVKNESGSHLIEGGESGKSLGELGVDVLSPNMKALNGEVTFEGKKFFVSTGSGVDSKDGVGDMVYEVKPSGKLKKRFDLNHPDKKFAADKKLAIVNKFLESKDLPKREELITGKSPEKNAEKPKEVSKKTEQIVAVEDPLSSVDATTKALESAAINNPDLPKPMGMGESKDVTPQYVSEQYHQAKTDGSNPELVNAVEKFLIPDTNSQSIKTESNATTEGKIETGSEQQHLGVDELIQKDKKTGEQQTSEQNKGSSSGSGDSVVGGEGQRDDLLKQWTLGYAPNREGSVDKLSEGQAEFDKKSYKQFVKLSNQLATDLGVKIVSDHNTLGKYSATSDKKEPTRYTVLEGSKEDVKTFAALMGVMAPDVQHYVMVSEYVETEGNAIEYSIPFKEKADVEKIVNSLLQYGINDYTFVPETNSLMIIDVGSKNSEGINKLLINTSNERESGFNFRTTSTDFIGEGDYGSIIENAGGDKRYQGDAGQNIRAILAIAKTKLKRSGGSYGEVRESERKRLEKGVEDYKKKFGKEYSIPEKTGITEIKKVDPVEAKRRSNAYDDLPVDDSANPEVKAAYEQLGKEIDSQYEYLTKDLGITVEFVEEDPYPDSASMVEDVYQNKHLRIYKGGEDHPFLGYKTADKNGVTLNEKFRAVHDFFGHAVEGNEFGATGEDRAWLAHSKMFSSDAQRAMTTETRGQNSWVNFSGKNDAVITKWKQAHELIKEGKVTEGNKLIKEGKAEFNYAIQKVALLPEEFSSLDVPSTEPLKERSQRIKQSKFSELKTAAQIEKVNAIVDKLKSGFPKVDVINDREQFDAVINNPMARKFSAGDNVYGAVHQGKIYLNPDAIRPDAPIHEFGHLWLDISRHQYPEFYKNLTTAIKDTEYFTEAKDAYPELTEQQQLEEASVQAVADSGVKLLDKKESEGVYKKVINAIKAIGNKIAAALGISKPVDFMKMKWNDLTDLVAKDLLGGKPITYATSDQIKNVDLTAYPISIEGGLMDLRKAGVDRFVNTATGKKHGSLVSYLNGLFKVGGTQPIIHNLDQARTRAITGRMKEMQETVYDWKKSISQLDLKEPELNKAIQDVNEFLVNNATINNVPEELQPVAQKMRDQVTALSQELLDSGFIDPNSDLHATISENLGVYMNRSYAAFTDKNWNKQMFPEGSRSRVGDRNHFFERVYRDAFDYVKNQFNNIVQADGAQYYLTTDANGNITGARDVSGNIVTDGVTLDKIYDAYDKHEKLTDDEAAQILKQFARVDKDSVFMSGGKIGRANIDMFKERKDIPKPLRAFLGEYESPEARYINTMRKMNEYVENKKFMAKVKEVGMNKIFFSKPTGDYDSLYSAEADKKNLNERDPYSPLSGLYTSPEIIAAMDKSGPSRDSFPWYIKGLYALNFMTKAGKTILAPRAQIRNFVSNFAITAANGYYSGFGKKEGGYADAWKLAVAEFKGAGGDVLKDLAEAGAIESSAAGKDMEALVKSVFTDEINLPVGDEGAFTKSIYDKTSGALKKAGVAASKVYQFGDNVHKIFNYFAVKAETKYMFPDKTEKELNDITKDRYKKTNVIYDMTPGIIQKLRFNPLFASFPSFAAEMFRISYNIPALAMQDIKEGVKTKNKKQTAVGVWKLANFATVAAGIPAAMAAINMYNGVDDDDKKLLWMSQPDYARANPKLIYRKKGTSYDYVDIGWVNPFSYMEKSLNSFTGTTKEEGVLNGFASGMYSLLQPFASEEINIATLQNVIQNDDGNGHTIYNKNDSWFGKTSDITKFFLQGMSPSVVGDINKIYKGAAGVQEGNRVFKLGDEAFSLATGLKSYNTDALRNLPGFAKKYGESIWEKGGIYDIYKQEAYKKTNDTEQQKTIDAAYNKANDLYHDKQNEMIGYISALRRKGVSDADMAERLKPILSVYEKIFHKYANIGALLGGQLQDLPKLE